MERTLSGADQLHFIVPCMGRLSFLKQTIERVLRQPNTTYTLIDYSCPQQSGQWTRQNYPQANVVFAAGRQHWNISEARNIGARQIQSGWLCFLDCDILLHPEFSSTILDLIRPGIYIGAKNKGCLYGTLVCSKADFDRCGGYDEILRGWGSDDVEMRNSLERIGIRSLELPEWMVEHIDHDDGLRTRLCDVKNMWLSDGINQQYIASKHTLLSSGAAYDQDTLQRLYESIRERYLRPRPCTIPEICIPTQVHFAFAICGYNNSEWLERNLTSIFSQDYPDYRIFYVDDASTDGTPDLAQELAHRHGKWDRVKLIRNSERRGLAANVYRIVHEECTDEEVIFLLDGEDWLLDETVLSKLAQVYMMEDAWFTCGSYIPYPPDQVNDTAEGETYSGPLPEENFVQGIIRHTYWFPAPPRTFYAWLFKAIELDDLMDYNANFLGCEGARAIMYPMVEMAGQRFCALRTPLYVRNVTHIKNPTEVELDRRSGYREMIRRKPPYTRIVDLIKAGQAVETG